MAEVEIVVEDVSEETDEVALRETTHKLFLASIGAAAMVQDKMVDLLARFVERGEAVEQKGRQRLHDRMERRKHQVRKLTRRGEKVSVEADAERDAEVEALLDRMNVPTKRDIDVLSTQVAELTKKVDKLKNA